MARVHRIDPATVRGIRRVRSRGRFRYIGPDDHAVDAATKARIVGLRVPPAWTRVWISPDPDGHIQATGVDMAGRRQYLYEPRWRRSKDAEKFDRALRLAEALPGARALVTRALRGDDERRRALAFAFRILDLTGLRVGSRRYLRLHGTRGLVTLRWADLDCEAGALSLSFSGKMSQRQRLTVEDPDLVNWVRAQPSRPPRELILRYRDSGRMHPLRAADVNAYISECAGNSFTAKDFRTLRGTLIAAAALAEDATDPTERTVEERERRAVDAVATALGNTRAVARSSYVDPRVFRAARSGRHLEHDVSPETALLRLVG